MTDKPEHEETTPVQAAAQEPETGAEDVLTRLEAERDDLRDKLLRTLADMENLRRRTEREVADAKAYAVTSFARDMLGSADNLRRALESSAEAMQGEAAPAVKSFVEGVELTERELLKTLERHGVRKIDPQGEKFDPNLHQAMFEGPHESIAKGLVSTVVQTGFKIGERVLRPALVGVSAGAGQKPAPAENGASGDGQPNA